MPHRRLPPAELLHQLLRYEPRTGLLRWRLHRDSDRVGTVAGSVSTRGYVVLGIGGVPFRAHRLIWRMVTGEDPGSDEIDHRDGDGKNNRWCNLRKSLRWQQTVNSNSGRNTSGYKGVYQRPSGRWCAQIRAAGVTELLGTYDTPEEASRAYQKRAQELHGDFRKSL